MSFNKKPKTTNPDQVDPSVYYYDEVYDEMKDEEETKSNRHRSREKEKDKSSKYVKGLMETAEFRKTEKELRMFKRNIKDREEAEKNGNFDVKDVYVTSTYKKKLHDYKEMEKEKMKRLEQEKGNSMNFLKKQAVYKSENHKLNIETKESPNLVNINQEKQNCDKLGPCTSTECHKISEDDLKKIIKKPLKSLEDRREYLREVLAKKTIGKAYDDAVQRYMERKSQSQ